MCTSFDDDEKVFNSLKAGANGYIVKSDPIDTILNAVLDVLQGGAPMSSGIAKKVIQYFHTVAQDKRRIDTLTAKENELLKLLPIGLL